MVIATSLLGALGLVACVAQTAAGCSMSAYVSVRAPGVVSFIGTASADTALAGPGRMKFASDSTQRPIFGQVVRVERLGADTEASLGRNAKDIVVVPWGYGADCATWAWNSSARWVRPDTRGVFTGRLRDSADWIDGHPTIDVTAPLSMPYTGIIPPRYSTRSTNLDAALTVDQALDLYDHLPLIPRPGSSAASMRASADPLLQWAREHADLSARYPAREILRETRYTIKMAVIQGTRSPLAGTYRFTIRLPAGDSATIVARTEQYPVGALWSTSPSVSRTIGPDGLPASVGHSLLTQVALTESELPPARDFTEATLQAQGYLTLVDEPIATSRDSTLWRGSADIVDAASRVVRDPMLGSRLRTAGKGIYELLQAKATSFAEGRFITYPDGRIRYEVRMPGTGALLFSMHGERLSTVTLAPR